MTFIEHKWVPYVVTPDGHVDRHYYELCVLWNCAMPCGGQCLAGFQPTLCEPRDVLIPKDRCLLSDGSMSASPLPTESTTRFAEREQELAELFARVDPLWHKTARYGWKTENLVISP